MGTETNCIRHRIGEGAKQPLGPHGVYNIMGEEYNCFGERIK